ncbi:MAG: penicillin-binding protein activator LpoB [Deltaproteobacteria bacterium]|nr:penicillin-binding protein activator LpoB [Deltaproteobacteria bacterium]
MKFRSILISSVMGLPAFFSACDPAFQAEYSNPDAVEIVDDRWNETDARKTAEILISSMLSKPWLNEFNRAHGQKPILIVDDIENSTAEHIDTKAIGEALLHELINSGQIRFVDASRRDKILKEVKYQQESGMVAEASRKKTGRQMGADFLMGGGISTQVHMQGGLKTVSYTTFLKLTNLETAEVVWTEKYDIKKRFKRSGAGW